MATTIATARKDTAFLGHPIGLAWLSASEFWERFSYYGMQALLVLYASHYLLQPGHVEHVIGFEWLKKFIELQYGANLSPQAMAIGIAGQYAALVYVTPLAGGILADRFIGRTNTVTIGALLMALGQFMMALDSTFLIAILCMLVGVGCFKGNIASQVGDLYSHDDPRRADAFQIYFLGIQISVIIAPIICSTLGERVDWRLGFAAAGVGMLIGLVVYLFGRPTFPAEPLRKKKGQDAPTRPPLTSQDWKVVAILVVLLPILALSLLSNQEIFAAYLIWAEKNYQIVFFGETMPIGWMLSVDAGISMVLMVGVIAFWRWWGKRWREPTELGKIIIGTAISACAPLVLALASTPGRGDRPSRVARLGGGVPCRQRSRLLERAAGRSRALFARGAERSRRHHDRGLLPASLYGQCADRKDRRPAGHHAGCAVLDIALRHHGRRTRPADHRARPLRTPAGAFVRGAKGSGGVARAAWPSSNTTRAWQRMLSGRRLDLLDPSPLDVEIEDIAHGLARVARWNGQTKGAHAFSVAQHCVLVERLSAELNPKIGRDARLMALLHDAPEYVIGDLISPFKAAVGHRLQGFRTAAARRDPSALRPARARARRTRPSFSSRPISPRPISRRRSLPVSRPRRQSAISALRPRLCARHV